MSVFDEVKMTWGGVVYSIPPDKMMGAIARIEDHVTMDELLAYSKRSSAPVAKICSAFASVLRYAGAKVEADEVYASVFSQGPDHIVLGIQTLMMMMVPPSATSEASPPVGKDQPAAASSKKRTKLRSVRANG